MNATKALRGLVGPVIVVVVFLLGTRYSPAEVNRPLDPSGTPAGAITWAEEDWIVLLRTLDAAHAAGHHELPMGELMAEVGRGLVGTPYVPHTLEAGGMDELLVVNLQGFDCVTFIESVFALSVLIKTDALARVGDRGGVEGEFERAVRAVRYRDNSIDGYASRLHYFSDWIDDGENKRLLTNVTAALGGDEWNEPVDFMTTHPDSYAQLADEAVFAAVQQTERRLSARPMHVIPQDRIAEAAPRIRNGDIIAATSTIEGLDVAHTGLAVWVDGALHLMHAPLVGDSVEVSSVPLADRIMGFDGQNGIIVARALEPRVVGGGR
ncbi:MAG: N-acetylmuramoyl-L-alanine amidase-like domain-containing protein [Gemmatimonadota bacterium]